MYGKNIHIIYHNELYFYHALKLSVNLGTKTAQSLLNHKEFKI